MIFHKEDVVLSSGQKSSWIIRCENLPKKDWDGIAHIAMETLNLKFRYAVGIPRGGIKFAKAMEAYATHLPEDPVLVVDDVFTTGQSIKHYVQESRDNHITESFIFLVAFARTRPPPHINVIWQLDLGSLESDTGTIERGAKAIHNMWYPKVAWEDLPISVQMPYLEAARRVLNVAGA
jgi:hypothetical protein